MSGASAGELQLDGGSTVEKQTNKQQKAPEQTNTSKKKKINLALALRRLRGVLFSSLAVFWGGGFGFFTQYRTKVVVFLKKYDMVGEKKPKTKQQNNQKKTNKRQIQRGELGVPFPFFLLLFFSLCAWLKPPPPP